MRHIGNVHTNLPQSLACGADGECIVKVLGIGRVNGKCCHTAEILALGNLLGCYVGRQLACSLLNGSRIGVWQAILGQYSIHLGIVVAALAKDVNNLAYRVLALNGPLKQLYHSLVATLSALEQILWNKNVIRHYTVLGD